MATPGAPPNHFQGTRQGYGAPAQRINATPMQDAPGQGDKMLAAAEYTWKDFSNYYGPKAIFIGLFILANIGMFCERFFAYLFDDSPKPTPYLPPATLYGVIGYGLPIARGAANALKLDCALLLITVLRNMLSFLRTTCCAKFLPLDKNIVFHKGIAWTIFFWVLVHMGGHYANYYSIHKATGGAQQALRNVLPFYPLSGPAPSTHTMALLTAPGGTGHLIVLIMVLMYSSAILSIRRPFFEMFWFTHHLFILFYLILCFHGFPGLLEPAAFYLWFAGPFALYMLERVLRCCRGNEDTVLGMCIQHPGKVIELRMKKATFNYMPGQYLFMCCPTISKHEWHPFTITSAPEEDFISCHIRIVGDWTGALQKLFNPDNRMGVVAQDVTTSADGLPILKLDGSFGAASEEVFHFKTVVLVGAGIGVTPFASILKAIRYRLERQKATGIYSVPINKVYFFWISRDRAAFEWFSELLSALEKDNIDNFLEINTYLTGALKPNEIRNVMYGEDDGRDAITGLQSSTHFGRPNWPVIFDQLAVRHQGEEVGAFFCGPSVLSKVLYSECRRITMTDQYNTKFKYNKENF